MVDEICLRKVDSDSIAHDIPLLIEVSQNQGERHIEELLPSVMIYWDLRPLYMSTKY